MKKANSYQLYAQWRLLRPSHSLAAERATPDIMTCTQ